MKDRKTKFILSALLASTVFVPSAAFAKDLNVVASFTVLQDVVHQIGGSHVKVKTLVGPNGDPHEFSPSPNDAKNLKAADLVFVSGEGLEGWMNRLISASGYKGKPVIVSQGIKTRRMKEDGREIIDPHVWNSPKNVEIWVKNISKALQKADPEDAAIYAKNAANYMKVLKGLDTHAHKVIDSIPRAKRYILTSHDAFGYFGREYKVKFLAPIGLSTENEASAGDVAKLIDQIKKDKVTIYFFENSNDPRLVKQIANATGAKPGGELYVEALSKPNGPAPTYAKMFKRNVDMIASALKQQASM